MNLETLLLAAALLLGLAPLALLVRRRVLRPIVAIGIGVSLGLGAWARVALREVPVSEASVEARPIAVEDEGYASSNTCQSCHPDQYASWHTSYHRRMTQVAGPDAVVGDFGDEGAGVTLTAFGQSERMWRAGGEFWIERKNPLWRPMSAEEPTITRRIVLTTGSHNMQFYWYSTEHGREVGLAGFIWLIAEQRWIPYAAEGMTPPHTTGADLAPQTGSWNRGCIHCHTTRAKMRIRSNPIKPVNPLEPKKNLLDTQVTEFGISCEACHGPGEAHVAQFRDPTQRYGRHLQGEREPADSSIVNPAKLSPRRSTQVCGQCHGVVLAFKPSNRGPAQRALSEHGFAYRPGDELSATRAVVRPSDPGNASNREVELLLGSQPSFLEERFWDDGVVRVGGREMNGIIESPCFREGHNEGEISCLSCHDLHQRSDDARSATTWANDMLGPGMESDEACLQCHDGFRADIEAHTRHPSHSSGSRCYNCHMPYTSYGLLKAIRSHTIRSPDVGASVSVRRPNACNQCHLDQTVAWAARTLHDWYGAAEPKLSVFERSVPAGALWLLSGDAGQRGLMAWSMGWNAAREASGDEWMGEFLPQLLDDPYGNVRLIAHRSLTRLPGFENFAYDALADPPARREARARALALWRTRRVEAGEPTSGLHLLDDPDGMLPPNVFRLLLSQRDDRRVVRTESRATRAGINRPQYQPPPMRLKTASGEAASESLAAPRKPFRS
jgi:hypothetical protein